MPERYVEWLRNGADPAKFGADKPDCCVILIKPSGDLFLAEDGLYFSGPIKSQFHAIGSGAKYALGAMAHGATAEQAVGVACQFDMHCGGDVMTLEPLTVMKELCEAALSRSVKPLFPS
jgi:hypothetical protein